jgi:hypothetical protein
VEPSAVKAQVSDEALIAAYVRAGTAEKAEDRWRSGWLHTAGDMLNSEGVEYQMADSNKREQLETEAIVIGYAMSRLDQAYLAARGHSRWNVAYNEAAGALAKPANTFKNLRDEFDPVHANPRHGWDAREMRASRQRVLDELCGVSDAALLELVDRVLKQDVDSTAEAIDSLAEVNHIAANVAERLLTGRLAEEYFLEHSMPLIEVPRTDILDFRQNACGYDFGVKHAEHWAIEVKGLKQFKGGIVFTEREWLEAGQRKENYWVVVIGNLIGQPTCSIFRDPHISLKAQSRYRHQLVVDWHAYISLFH